MSCRARCSPAPGQVNAQASDCIDLFGDGSAVSPLEAAPILDPRPTNQLECSPAGLLVEAGIFSASAALILPVAGPVAPGPPGPPALLVGPVNVSITNTTDSDIDVLMLVAQRQQAFIEGTCAIDVKAEVDVDGGGPINVTQLQADLMGAVSADPALGGDGTANPFGINGIHTSTGDTFTGYNPDSITPTQGAPLAPGATKSVDLTFQLSYLGLWNASVVGLAIAQLTLIGMTRA